MKVRLQFKLDGKEQCIDVPCESHQSPMIPVFVTVIDGENKMRQAKYINVSHRGGLKFGGNWNKP